jgi:hypothetical protein
MKFDSFYVSLLSENTNGKMNYQKFLLDWFNSEKNKIWVFLSHIYVKK